MLNDAHCHFFSARFLEALGRDRGRPEAADAAAIAAELGWETPGTPEGLADRWIVELDRSGVSRAAIMASVPGDEDSVGRAIVRHRDRLVGYFMLNPIAPDAVARATRAFSELRLRCACLFPAMHHYALTDDRVGKIFDVAAAHRAALFVHCGYLSIAVRTRLGLASRFDLRLGDPLALAAVAAAFPAVPVIVPHFGAGYFREALMAADACPSIHFDTSSSNGWLKFVPGLSLADAFQRVLAVAGPTRLLFGTDSSYFPRGWRRQIHDAQTKVLDELGVEPETRVRIFGGNFDRLFPPSN